MTRLLKINKYISRDKFILERVKGKTVLHLGCIGETDSDVEIKLKRAPFLLHSKVEKVAKETYGIDIDAAAIDLYRNKLNKQNLFVGDVEKLENVELNKKFDIVLFTDLLEHLSNPGLALEGIKRFITAESEVIISVPHSFGLPNFIRNLLGCSKEGNQHVANYNSANIYNLLHRHGFKIIEIYTAFEKTYTGMKKFFIIIPMMFLTIFPKFGGTLVVVAKLK